MKATRVLAAYAEKSQLHICVDLASAADGIRQITGAHSPPMNARCLLESARTTNARDVSPWLLPCSSANAATWLRRSVELALDTPAVLWLFGPFGTEQLFERMVRRLDVQLADGTELLLRYFDPRILAELDHSLDGEDHTAFFAVCDRWGYLDRDGELREVLSTSIGATDPSTAPIVLQERSERGLLLATEAGQVLVETLKRWPDDLQRRAPQSRFELAKACCIESDAANLTSLADKVLLLMHVAEQADGYLDSALWQMQRQRLKGGQASLKSLLDVPGVAT